MAHPHAELLKRQDEAAAQGDVDGVMATFTDDVILHIAGRSSMAGEHKGKEAMAGMFGKYMASLGDDPQFETHAILADDDHAVQLQRVRASKAGQTLDVHTVNVVHFRDGLISEMWSVDDDPYSADPFYDS